MLKKKENLKENIHTQPKDMQNSFVHKMLIKGQEKYIYLDVNLSFFFVLQIYFLV